MRTPLGRVLHLGAAGGGTEHFWRMRVTGAANFLLVVAFIAIMVSLVGRSHADIVATICSPLASAVFVLLILSVAIHMRSGIQIAIEDYIHNEPLKIGLLLLATFFSAAIAAVGVIAVLSMTFGS